MRTQHEDKAERLGPPRLEPPECQVGHRLYIGAECPGCGKKLPVGPYTSAQMTEYFGAGVFLNGRPISEPDPAEIANPILDRELELRRELKAMNDRAQESKIALSVAESKGDRDGVADSHSALLVAESEIVRIGRAIRREEAQRAGRIRSWRTKHPR
jgi:hypothetical protein